MKFSDSLSVLSEAKAQQGTHRQYIYLPLRYGSYRYAERKRISAYI